MYRSVAFLALLLFFSVTLNTVHAQGLLIENVEIIADIVDDNVYFTYVLDVSSEECINNFTVTVPYEAILITSYMRDAQVDGTTDGINARFSLDTCVVLNKSVFFIRMYAASSLSSNNAVLTYTFSSPADAPTKHTLLFPEWLSSNKSIISVSPSDFEASNVSITWREQGAQTYVVQLRKENKALSLFFLIFFIVVGVLIVAFSCYHIVRLIKSSRQKKSNLAGLNVLEEFERQVMREVIENPGVYQHIVLRKLGLKKSHGSKVITRLERRAILRRQREGKINRLYVGERYN